MGTPAIAIDGFRFFFGLGFGLAAIAGCPAAGAAAGGAGAGLVAAGLGAGLAFLAAGLLEFPCAIACGEA